MPKLKYEHWYNEIVNLYVNQKFTVIQIASQLNIPSTSTVERILHRMNVECHGRIEYKNKFYHNDDIFASNHFELPYWVGFLLTDGNVCYYSEKIRAPRIALQWKESDKELLEQYVNFLDYHGPITQDKKKRWTVVIHSNKIAQDLSVFGIVERKIFIAKAPEQYEHNNLFWRGCLDGDGSIWFQNGVIRLNLISASVDFIEQFQEYCNNILDNSSDASISSFLSSSNNDMWRITYSGNFALRILDKIYEDIGPRLSRKYLKYLSYKEDNYALVWEWLSFVYEKSKTNSTSKGNWYF